MGGSPAEVARFAVVAGLWVDILAVDSLGTSVGDLRLITPESMPVVQGVLLPVTRHLAGGQDSIGALLTRST